MPEGVSAGERDDGGRSSAMERELYAMYGLLPLLSAECDTIWQLYAEQGAVFLQGKWCQKRMTPFKPQNIPIAVPSKTCKSVWPRRSMRLLITAPESRMLAQSHHSGLKWNIVE